MSGETEKNVSGWTTDTLREFFITLNSDTRTAFVAADGAAELRNEQRFNAQQQAVKDALTAQEKAVAAALEAAEKAVLVAETNAEKWRGAANEWRGAMNDRERMLMPRSEAEQRLEALGLRIEASNRTNADAIKTLTAAVERGAGRREGLMVIFAIIAAIATVISIVVAVRGRL